MLQAHEVTAENANEALAQAVTETRGLITTARRVHEVSTALAQSTGRPEDRRVAERADAVVRQLDLTLDALLREEAS